MGAPGWEHGSAMTVLPLVFEAPRRGKPPRHLADLTREEARAAVTELGQPAFRADQLARHFYRGVTDPAQMTDLPAAVREELTGALLPGLLTPVRTLSADGGRTRKTLWRLHDGAGRERADALPGPRHRLHLQPGRLRHGLPLLRHRPERPDPQPVGRRDHRAGEIGRASCRERV